MNPMVYITPIAIVLVMLAGWLVDKYYLERRIKDADMYE